MRSRGTRRLLAPVVAGALATTLVTGLLGAPAAHADTPTAGTAGIGDPMFPLDGNGGIDVQNYTIKQRLGFAHGWVRGTTTVTLKATQDLSRFNLDFLLTVKNVTVDGQKARFTKKHGHELVITPAAPLARGATARVKVTYAGRPSTKSYGFSLGHQKNVVVTKNSMMAVSEPHSAPWWYPANDHPRDVATYDVTTTVPKNLQVIGNGNLISRTVVGNSRTWRWRSRDAIQTYAAFFVAGRYTLEKTKDLSGRPTWYAVSKELSAKNQRAAMKQLRRTPAITRKLERLLGRPYPSSTNGGVVTGVNSGFALETHGRPVYSWWGSIPLAHELAHQWFGNDVRFDRWQDLWLSEGFASFMDDWSGESAHWKTRDSLLFYWRTMKKEKDVWRPISPLKRKNLFGSAVYVRGQMTLAALRNRVGEATFRTILQRWLDERSGTSARSADFEELAATVSGQDLDGFFDHWLRSATRPARTAENGLTQGF